MVRLRFIREEVTFLISIVKSWHSGLLGKYYLSNYVYLVEVAIEQRGCGVANRILVEIYGTYRFVALFQILTLFRILWMIFSCDSFIILSEGCSIFKPIQYCIFPLYSMSVPASLIYLISV